MSTNELNSCFTSKNYLVDLKTDIPSQYRSKDPHSAMPANPVNGGLYSGPSSKKPWMPIDITPTATNYIHRNLLSANPPPGATEQYVGTNRLGNNYTATPEVYWMNNVHQQNPGPFNLKVTK